ncbi:Translation initiation factor IF-2, partial [Frankliniella fusca]
KPNATFFVHTGWLEKTSVYLIRQGQQEAWYRLCKCALWCHATQLKKHMATDKHQRALKDCPSVKGSKQTALFAHGPGARHAAGVDRGHRGRDYSLIVDESTDTKTIKHMALMVRYFSAKEEKIITDFLGLVETPRTTAEDLYWAVTEFLLLVGFNVKKMRDVPNLHLVKCICHALDKCSSAASRQLAGSLEILIRESRNWFSNSALRKVHYCELYETLTGREKPPHLVRLATTRWLLWYGAVKSHTQQYDELRTLFRSVADADQGRECPIAHHLAELHEHGSHRVYITFLASILKETAAINVAFQRRYADISKAHADLRTFIETMARRILKPEAILCTQASGMVSLTELQALKVAMLNEDNFLPLDLVKFSGEGEGFYRAIVQERLSEEQKGAVMKACKNFLHAFVTELLGRLPSCVEGVAKMRAFVPSVALGERGRPRFSALPKDLISQSEEKAEEMASQWEKFASMSLQDFCPDEEDVKKVDIVKFWAAVGAMKDGGGELNFKELAGFALSFLTLPLSNAVVERLFSVLGVVKKKLRNRMGLEMLNSIFKIRTHLHAKGLCCVNFTPTPHMLASFTARLLYAPSRAGAGGVEVVEAEE